MSDGSLSRMARFTTTVANDLGDFTPDETTAFVEQHADVVADGLLDAARRLARAADEGPEAVVAVYAVMAQDGVALPTFALSNGTPEAMDAEARPVVGYGE